MRIKSVLRVFVLVALLAVFSGLINHSVRHVRYSVDGKNETELKVTELSLTHSIKHAPGGGFTNPFATPPAEAAVKPQSKKADTKPAAKVKKAASQKSAADKPAVKKPAQKKAAPKKIEAKKATVNKPAVKKPQTKKTAPKSSAKKTKKSKPGAGKACPT